MEHKETCKKKTDANAPCDCGAEAPPTRTCWDCGAEVGANEKACPKCKTDLKLADEEDGVVEKSLKRLAAKNKAKKKGPEPGPSPEPKKKHVFNSLSKLLK